MIDTITSEVYEVLSESIWHKTGANGGLLWMR